MNKEIKLRKNILQEFHSLGVPSDIDNEEKLLVYLRETGLRYNDSSNQKWISWCYDNHFYSKNLKTFWDVTHITTTLETKWITKEGYSDTGYEFKNAKEACKYALNTILDNYKIPTNKKTLLPIFK